MEQTLVLIKPDGVQRNLSGKIISRFEDMGLKIIAMKMLKVDDAVAKEHYYLDEKWAKELYEKKKTNYEKEGKEIEEKDHLELGEKIQGHLRTFLREGPIIAMVLEGPHAIELVRKVIGGTEPRSSLPGTIRSDYASTESYSKADDEKRAIRNLVHASDAVESAKREIGIWFSIDEIHSQ